MAAVLVSGAWSLPAAAGPWAPAPGSGYAKVGMSWLPGVAFMQGPEVGERVPNPSLYGFYSELHGVLYGELGIAPRLAAFGSWLPLRTFLLVDPVDGHSLHASVGEPELGLRWQIGAWGPVALGLQGSVRAPTSSNRPVADVHAITEGNAKVGELRIATGVWEGTFELSAGAGLGKGYVTGGLGVTARSGGWDSVLRWSAEGGVDLGPRGGSQGRLKVYGFHPLLDGQAAAHQSPSGLGQRTHYLAFSVELDRRLADGWAVGVSVAGGLGFVVRQTGGPVIGVGVSRSW